MKSTLSTKPFRRLVVELLVVVFGILIAFTVDRWNQDRQDRATATQYVEALSEDLAADTATLRVLAGLYRDREAAAQRVLDAIESDAAFEGDPEALAWDIKYSGYVTSFSASDFTYHELLSTGGLGLIERPDLKRALVAYYQSTEFLGQFYPLWQKTAVEFYQPEVRLRVSPTDWFAIENSGVQAEGHPFSPDATLAALRQDSLIEKLLTTMMIALRQQASSHEALRDDAVALLSLLATR